MAAASLNRKEFCDWLCSVEILLSSSRRCPFTRAASADSSLRESPGSWFPVPSPVLLPEVTPSDQARLLLVLSSYSVSVYQTISDRSDKDQPHVRKLQTGTARSEGFKAELRVDHALIRISLQFALVVSVAYLKSY